MLDVWYSISPPPLSPCLDPAEQRRRDRFLFDRGRHAFTNAHTLKRLVLSCYQPGLPPGGWRFASSERGKPAIVQPVPYRFNLSHSGPSVAVAVADADVGVDIERCRPMPRMGAVAETVFHPAERRWLWRQSSIETHFFRLWTMKEALLKAAGTGFSYPAARFCCEGLDNENVTTAWVAGFRWRCFTRYVGVFALSVAVPYDFPDSGARYFSIELEPQAGLVPDLAQRAVGKLLRYVRMVE
jgi:4'-phosphopantetheinyl transferase superfamily protein